MADLQDQTSDNLVAHAVGSGEVHDGAMRERDGVTIDEFVRATGISLSTVRRYLAAGKLPKFQPGGSRCRVLIPRHALDALLRQQSQQAGDERSSATTAASQLSKSKSMSEPMSSGPVPRWMGRRS